MCAMLFQTAPFNPRRHTRTVDKEKSEKKPTFWLGRQIIHPATEPPPFDRFSHSAQGVNEAYCAARI